jgi:hypothetical protein
LYATGKYTKDGNTLAIGDAPLEYATCAQGNTMKLTPQGKSPTVTGAITLQKSSEGTGGTGGNGGTTGKGGSGGTSSIAGTGGTGGTTKGGGSTSAGGTGGTGGTTSAGGATGSGSGPCDIYAAASTPCVAAYSMIRVLAKDYTGPLYQVRKGGGDKNTGSGGTTKDILAKDGFADAAAQDDFCGTDSCTVAKLYDQSGKKNDLVVSKKGCYIDTASEDDWETSAKRKSVTVGGRKLYSLATNTHEGYRNNNPTAIPANGAQQGIYELVDGTRWGGYCCWDFGTASKDNCYTGGTGSMNALFFGQYIAWGKGAEKAPWFMVDFEAGIWAGGSGKANEVVSTNPSMGVPFAFGVTKNDNSKYAIRVGNGQSGSITKVSDANLPFTTWKVAGGIILGTGGDNSNSGYGTFFEGAILSGRPTDEADAAVLKNIQDAKYGQ